GYIQAPSPGARMVLAIEKPTTTPPRAGTGTRPYAGIDEFVDGSGTARGECLWSTGPRNAGMVSCAGWARHLER
ncbi:MAG: hypothetical protein ACRDFX_02735, partial [Chloroflexota bacterium]